MGANRPINYHPDAPPEATWLPKGARQLVIPDDRYAGPQERMDGSWIEHPFDDQERWRWFDWWSRLNYEENLGLVGRTDSRKIK